MVREFSCPSRPVAVGQPMPAGPRPLMGRLRHGEFSHNFRYRAHQEMDETRAGFLPLRAAFTARERRKGCHSRERSCGTQRCWSLLDWSLAGSSRSTTSSAIAALRILGMVLGGGVNIAATDAASVFLEFRYHYIWGPEINPGEAASLTGTTGKRANGQFLPITVGIRF